MRIVVVETDGFGGLAHFSYQMANALVHAGADVTLLTAREYELAHLPHACTLDASLSLWRNVSLDSDRTKTPTWLRPTQRRLRRGVRAVRLLAVWRRLTRRLVRERPDVVQFSEIRFPILAPFVSRLRRAGITVTQICHEFVPRESGTASRWLVRHSAASLYSSFSLMFFLGEGIREEFLRSFAVPRARTAVIPMGDASLFTRVDRGQATLRERYDLSPAAPVALFFGGLRPSKGLEDLIAAFRGVVARIPAARLLVVGMPQASIDPKKFVALAAEAGISASVTIDARYVPASDVGALVRTANVVVLPYRSGTSSAALQVAYAFARPAVVTDVGSLAEAVVPGVTGLVVPAGDQAALTDALTDLLADPTRAEELGAAGRRRSADQHGWPAIAGQILHLTAGALLADRAARSASRP